MNRSLRLLILSSLVFGIACGDDDVVMVDSGPMMDAGPLPDVPGMDIRVFDGGDPCTGIEPERMCATAGTTCAGDVLTECAPNVNGCLVTTEMDCSTVMGATCDDSGAVAMCTSDPCLGITNCMMEARTCTDDTLTVCAPDAMGCLVEATTDCAADGTTCDDTGAMAMCVDACDGISDCDMETRACDMDNLVVCAPDAAGCLVETTTDCTATGGTCDGMSDPVACLDPVCAPATSSGVTLDCDSATIMGTTMGGTNFFGGYCGDVAGTDYDSPEVVYAFADARVASVTITAVRDAASTLDMDLFVIDGGDGSVSCEAGTGCVAGSVGATDTEVVTFDYVPGSTNYVAYDAYQAMGGTSAYTLTVECTFSTCGDSMIEGAEECDDGNAMAMDGCSDLCQVEPGYTCTTDMAGQSTCVLTCGDGMVDGTDECDDSNRMDGDGCSAACTIETGYICTEDMAGLSTCELSCGNGVIDGTDECDDDNAVDGDGCTACVVDMGFSCTGEPSVCEATCGNGLIDAGEACDDANMADGDGCAMDCSVEGGFACANNESFFGGGPSVCAPELFQIDGVLEDADTPWDRANEDCTASTTTTVFEAVEYTNSTGASQTVDILATYEYDGYLLVYSDVVDPAAPETNCVPEGSDDFFTTDHSLIEDVVVADGATIQIVVTSFGATDRGAFSVSVVEQGIGCGNGLLDTAGDVCDDGNTTDGDGCSAACTPEMGFECDGAEPTVCAMVACGNGIVQTGEDCDDMNMMDGDGCSAACAFEAGFVCDAAEPTVCRAISCGDGIIDAPEECDDMNMMSMDGCSATCVVEAGFLCTGEPSVCASSTCGNSMVEVGEVCDDGNVMGGDGCEADCRSAVFTGTIDGSEPFYNRLGEGLLCTSAGRDDVHHDVVPFTWDGAADDTLLFTVVWPTGDGYIHAYMSPFDPSMPMNGCIVGDDDFATNGMLGTRGSQMSVDMTAGQSIDAVLSTWQTMTIAGDWELTVTLAP